MKYIYPKNKYEPQQTLFEKLEGFNFPVSQDNKLSNNLAIFNFESICVPTEELKGTQTTTWIVKHVPISVSISSNLIDEPTYLYKEDPQNLIIDFVSNLELLAEKSKRQMIFQNPTSLQKKPLSTESLLAKVKHGSLFGYVQCDLVVPDELKSKYANFSPSFKKH